MLGGNPSCLPQWFWRVRNKRPATGASEEYARTWNGDNRVAYYMIWQRIVHWKWTMRPVRGNGNGGTTP